ncbi:SufD family Fe-S cluster assembly protein [Enterobacteriaceae endosymbiont of Donacia piscatrix]|uniref:SufD family Fe-S cluster assembly protein n=1 Tax=Enterobacteriaceae endosymbiont of Donacia piscatrix TaxID=2675780 RepID=UPI0014496BCB|nr:SufD family Fe-S cluster assembly protein [Enterobacteriaceae endosymbiont of Donacia piscatrix]QJC34996.1 hypothetical protein GJT96_01760 [Enterobacteriaceae endosymbiont of Donacia piscatrix]
MDMSVLMKDNIYNKFKNLYKLNKKYFYFNKSKTDLYKLKNFLKKELLYDNQKLLFKYLNNNLLINSKSLPINNNNKLFKLLFPIDAVILFFINGKINKKFSNINNKYYKININYTNHNNNFFKKNIYHYLSESFTKKNILIDINHTKNINSKKPLYIVYFNDKNKKNEIAIFNYRNFIYVKNIFSTIIEHYINTDKLYINNVYNTFIINNNSKLEHYTFITNNNIINNNFCSINNEFILYNNVSYKKYDVLMSNQYINQNNNFKFLGEKTKLVYNSLSFSKNSNIININNYLEHDKKNSCSVQIHKAVTLDQSIINLIGLLKINKHAIKTNGQLNYSVLLLNKLSKINIQPYLDILNNDVKCTHSVFTGKINYNQIFFLRTRGISLKKSYSILLISFILDSLDEISNNIIKNEILQKILCYLSVENIFNEF